MTNPFFGKENEVKEPTAASAALRKYEIVIDGQPDTVEAHYITRDPGHVCFWKTRPDNQQDTLVVAITNNMLDELKEVTS